MKKYIPIILFFIWCCGDEETSDLDESSAYVGVAASGIIDFETDAFEDDTMYTWYDILGITVTASYDSNATDFNEIYKKVNPGQYYWSGRGITFYIDTTSFQIAYDTTDVSGEFVINDGDICIFSISTDDSLKIGVTTNSCSDE